LSDGEASLFIRPYEVTVVPESGSALLSGIVKRVHGFGPARRLEIALREGDREHFIEVSAPRHEVVGIGQHVGLRPRAYRLFASSADRSQGV
jgi:sulfate transport system ATP-binding protein